MKIPLVATLIVATSAIVLAQQPQRSGEIFSITVYVMDADGQMVLRAEVRAMHADRGGVISQGVTSLGRCTLAVAGPGRYLVYSSKNKKGYNQIDEALAKLDPEGISAVVVSEYLPKAATVVRLRPSPGKLIVKLIDSETGRPLEKAQLVLRREHSPNDQFTRPLTPFTRNGTIKMLVPSLPLELSASAPGYENWSYSDPKKDFC